VGKEGVEEVAKAIGASGSLSLYLLFFDADWTSTFFFTSIFKEAIRRAQIDFLKRFEIKISKEKFYHGVQFRFEHRVLEIGLHIISAALARSGREDLLPLFPMVDIDRYEFISEAASSGNINLISRGCELVGGNSDFLNTVASKAASTGQVDVLQFLTTTYGVIFRPRLAPFVRPAIVIHDLVRSAKTENAFLAVVRYFEERGVIFGSDPMDIEFVSEIGHEAWRYLESKLQVVDKCIDRGVEFSIKIVKNLVRARSFLEVKRMHAARPNLLQALRGEIAFELTEKDLIDPAYSLQQLIEFDQFLESERIRRSKIISTTVSYWKVYRFYMTGAMVDLIEICLASENNKSLLLDHVVRLVTYASRYVLQRVKAIVTALKDSFASNKEKRTKLITACFMRPLVECFDFLSFISISFNVPIKEILPFFFQVMHKRRFPRRRMEEALDWLPTLAGELTPSDVNPTGRVFTSTSLQWAIEWGLPFDDGIFSQLHFAPFSNLYFTDNPGEYYVELAKKIKVCLHNRDLHFPQDLFAALLTSISNEKGFHVPSNISPLMTTRRDSAVTKMVAVYVDAGAQWDNDGADVQKIIRERFPKDAFEQLHSLIDAYTAARK